MSLDPWGFGIDVPDDYDPISFRRRRWRDGKDLGWEEGIGVVQMVWCGVEPVIDLLDGSHIFPGIGDTWRAL